MKQQQGFTLIELIIVIVILGILAAFALPRFANLSGNAETAVIEGARASVQSSSGIVRAQALVENELDTGPITIESEQIDLVNGYLAADSVETMAQLANDFTVDVIAGAAATDPEVAHITLLDPIDGSPCFTFTESTAANNAPDISGLSTWDTTVSPALCN